MKKLILAATLVVVQLLGCAQAESDSDAKAIAAIKKELASFDVSSVAPSPIPGLYEVIANGQVVYFTGDLKYIVNGSLIDNVTKIDITQKRMDELNSKAFAELEEGDYLAFKPEKGEPKFVLNVFTDVDCGFCRKLHQEVPKLTAKGVEVRYFLYPRAGPTSGSARKLEAIWCADDKQTAMTRAKSGQSVESKRCANPIGSHIALANQMGLTGTPLLFTGGGTRISGYRPADQLYAMLLSEEAEK